MNTQDQVVVQATAAAFVGTVTKVYKDGSALVQWMEGRVREGRFTKYGEAHGAGRSAAPDVRFVPQDEVQQRVDTINAQIAEAQAERQAQRNEREAAQRQRMETAAKIIECAAKEIVETVAGTLHIYNLRTATRDGMVALVVKCTGKARLLSGGEDSFYWGVTVVTETSMGAASELAQTADAAAQQYVAKCYA